MNKVFKEVVYVSGVALKSRGRTSDELTKLYGISTVSIKNIMRECGLLISVQIGKLDRDQLRMLERVIDEKYVTGIDLRRKESENIQKHRKRGTFKGIRIRIGLPVHGQRTSSNAKTAGILNKLRCKL